MGLGWAIGGFDFLWTSVRMQGVSTLSSFVFSFMHACRCSILHLSLVNFSLFLFLSSFYTSSLLTSFFLRFINIFEMWHDISTTKNKERKKMGINGNRRGIAV